MKKNTVCETSVGRGNWAGLNCWNGSRCFLKIRAGLESPRPGRTADWITIHVTYSCRADFIERERECFVSSFFLFFFFCSTLPLWHNPQLRARAEFRQNELLSEREAWKPQRGVRRGANHITLFPHMMPLLTFYTCSFFPSMNSLSYLLVFVLLNLNLHKGAFHFSHTNRGLMNTDVLKLCRDALFMCLRVLSWDCVCPSRAMTHALCSW